MDEQKKPESVPYTVYEAEMARKDKANRRWFIAWLITFLFLVGGFVGFVFYEAQFEDTVVTQDVDTGDGAAYVTGIGDVYGENPTDGQTANP